MVPKVSDTGRASEGLEASAGAAASEAAAWRRYRWRASSLRGSSQCMSASSDAESRVSLAQSKRCALRRKVESILATCGDQGSAKGSQNLRSTWQRLYTKPREAALPEASWPWRYISVARSWLVEIAPPSHSKTRGWASLQRSRWAMTTCTPSRRSWEERRRVVRLASTWCGELLDTPAKSCAATVCVGPPDATRSAMPSGGMPEGRRNAPSRDCS
mmetsp:Transcript_10644/g.36128  ORF Transcript_10644/g.36128 Transcript_10644/m.36128 type:complete len:216 (-) Transcript_10644:610-1257(-)